MSFHRNIKNCFEPLLNSGIWVLRLYIKKEEIFRLNHSNTQRRRKLIRQLERTEIHLEIVQDARLSSDLECDLRTIDWVNFRIAETIMRIIVTSVYIVNKAIPLPGKISKLLGPLSHRAIVKHKHRVACIGAKLKFLSAYRPCTRP